MIRRDPAAARPAALPRRGDRGAAVARGAAHPLRRFVAGLAIAVCALDAGAADADGNFALKGAGFLPCGVYVAERDKRSNTYYLIGGWVEGYVSAYNRFAPQTYDVASFESLELLLSVMQQHCAEHPGDGLYPVLNSILASLHPARIQRQSESVAIEEGERRTVLYRETITRMQTELARRGLYKAAVDGRFTDATRSAVSAFQADLNFERTGFPDQATLWRLFRK